MDWIKKMNEMFAANAYTDDGRVTVDYCKNSNGVLVKALNKTKFIPYDGLTDYGTMLAVFKAVEELYGDSDCEGAKFTITRR